MVVIVCLVVALIGALGWIFWQNFMETKDDTSKYDSAAEVKTDDEKSETPSQGLVYHDFRANKKDTTGAKVEGASDVAKLSDIGSKLKDYFSTNVGKSVETMDGKTAQVYIVDRLYGNYAAGTQMSTGAYLIWGPKDGNGEITNVAGAQNTAFGCDELKAAKVPSQLVDGKCLAADGSGTVEDYSQN